MSSSAHTKSDGSSSGYHYKTKVSNVEKVIFYIIRYNPYNIYLMYYHLI